MAKSPLPGMAGWTYEITSHDAASTTVAGYRSDTPAALPLVTASGVTAADAVESLIEAAKGWDGARG